MSYTDYFRKLNFGAVSSGVQNLKNNELSKLTNPINQQIDGYQSDIEGLQKQVADQSSSLGTASGILDTFGLLAGSKAIKGIGGKIINKLKSKFGKGKNSKEGEEEEGEGEADAEPSKGDFSGETKTAEPDGENPDEFAYSSDNPGVAQPNKAQRGETEGEGEEGGEGEGGEAAEADADDIVDGPSELNDVISTDLEPTTYDIPDTELGSGTFQSTEPAGTGEGDIEMQTFSSNQPQSGNAELNETDPGEFNEQLDADTAPEGDAGSGGASGDAADAADAGEAADAGDAADVADATDVVDAGVDAAEVGVDATAGTLETAGAVADAAAPETFGLSLIVGGILALAGAGVSIGEAVANNNDEDAEVSDEEQETSLDEQKNTLQANLAKQQFVGANVMPDLTSTALQNVTSSAF